MDVSLRAFDTGNTELHIAPAPVQPRRWCKHIAGVVKLIIDDLKRLLAVTLQLGPRASALSANSPLLGAVPELDSMAVVSVITALEEQFGITVEDDEIGAATFETLGSLAAFVEHKVANAS